MNCKDETVGGSFGLCQCPAPFVSKVDLRPRHRAGARGAAHLGRGTAEEKISATIKDIEAWPIPGLVVFAGEGFTENMRQFLISTGKAVEFEELRPWLCLFFGLPLGKEEKREA